MTAPGTFLAARRHRGRPAEAVILGVPFEGGISYRVGAAEGPRAVRAASQSIESYSPRTARDLADLDLADAGDLPVLGLSASDALAATADAVEGLAREGSFVVTLGGDHSVSIGTARGLRRVHPDLAHVVFDAHFDLRASYDGSELSHACGTRHMAIAGPTCVLGVRSGSRDEYAEAGSLLSEWSPLLEVSPAFRAVLEERPVFVSVDLDVLDPSILPGTGNPEPDGPSYRELREALLALAGLRVVAVDVVEVAPPLDPTGLSQVVAAELVREILAGIGPGR